MPLSAKFSEGSLKSNGDVAASQWWVKFSDSRLNSLVDVGLAQNVSILAAIEATNAAAGQVIVDGAGGLPALNVGGSHTVSGEMGNLRTQIGATNVSAGDLNVSWLLDLWGQYRRARQGALAELDAAYATVDVQRLAYLQDLVTSYVNVRYYQARIAIAQENLKSRRETLSLTKFQLDAGAASRLDVVQAEGLVNSTIAEVPGLEISLRQQIHHIALLLNVPSTQIIAEMQRGGGQPVFRGSVATGVPADLIRNRPDIRKAEQDLVNATAQIGVAQAQLYPTLTLGGDISPSFVHRPGDIKGGLTSWSFGPTLTLPILDGGRLRAGVDIANSTAKSQYLTWKSTVLSAIEQVENALSAVSRDAQTVSALRAQVKSYQEALQLSTASYKDGASSLLDVLDAQRSVTDAQESLATAIQTSAADYVSLNVAIGAGYVPASPKAAVAAGSPTTSKPVPVKIADKKIN